MATVTTSTRPRSLADSSQRVRHPLERLRGYIRFYVLAESLAVIALYLAIFFWVSLILDYGAFKLLSVDWVQSLPRWARALVLGGCVGCLLVVMEMAALTRRWYYAVAGGAALLLYVAVWGWLGVALDRGLSSWASLGLVLLTLAATLAVTAWLRLRTEFRDAALALVLERRFPALLGDRLITAVELANVREAAEVGYSAAMVTHTIHEAAEQVEKVPVAEVFDWKRLKVLAAAVGVLTLGAYLLMGLAFSAFDWASGAGGLGGYGRLNDVSQLWFERNILLQNSIWPRRAHLELVGFPEGGVLKMGRGTQPPSVRVRALQWVIADRGTPEGWRALTWEDLRTNPAVLGERAPEVELPSDWKPRDENLGLSVDEIELKLARSEVHATLPADAKDAFRDVLEKLEERSAVPSMARVFRKLVIPTAVEVRYWGASTNGRIPLDLKPGNEYVGQFTELKETVLFSAKGEDYYTAGRRIEVVPPPSLAALTRTEAQPRYLFEPRPRDPQEAKGQKRQVTMTLGDKAISDLPVSLSGDTSRFDVPAGTDLVLTAVSDKELSRDHPPRLLLSKGAAPFEAAVTLLDDGRSFRVTFPDVRRRYDFRFEFTDTDLVLGERRVLIEPVEDKPPDPELVPADSSTAMGIIRKTPQGYLVTSNALVPFVGRVRDDHGIEKVEYVYTRLPPDVLTQAAYGPVQGVAGLFAGVGGPPLNVLAPYRRAEDLVKDGKPTARPEEDKGRAEMRAFREALGNRLIKEFKVDLDSFEDENDPKDPKTGFDVGKLARWPRGLTADDVQPRYRMVLTVEASDNNVETGPGVGENKEKFTFWVVSETELLAEIAKEEEALHLKMLEVIRLLVEAESKLVEVNKDLTAADLKAEQFNGMSVRAADFHDLLQEKTLKSTQEVLRDYQRILRELRANRAQKGMRDRVQRTIVEPLDSVTRVEFGAAIKSMSTLRGVFDDKDLDFAAKTGRAREAGAKAREDVNELIKALNKVMGAMEGLIEIGKLIKELQKIEEEEVKQFDLIKRLRDKLEADLLKDLLGEPKPPDKKP